MFKIPNKISIPRNHTVMISVRSIMSSKLALYWWFFESILTNVNISCENPAFLSDLEFLGMEYLVGLGFLWRVVGNI